MAKYDSEIVPGIADDRKVFVGGTGKLTQQQLWEYFEIFGDIENIVVKYDPFTGRSKGYAFILYSKIDSIEGVLRVDEHYVGRKKVSTKKIINIEPLKIFVGGLTKDITDADVKDYFTQYGNIVDFQTPFDKTTYEKQNFCFVTFDSEDAVNEILKSPQQVIKDTQVFIRRARINSNMMGQRIRAGVNGTQGAYPGAYGVVPTAYGGIYGAESAANVLRYMPNYGRHYYSMGGYAGVYRGYPQPVFYGGLSHCNSCGFE